MTRVVICDDDEGRARDDWAVRIRTAMRGSADPNVRVLSAYELAAAIEDLEKRSVDARRSRHGQPDYEDQASVIDHADVLVIDYDLTPDPDRLTESDPDREKVIWFELRAQTAETVAYLARSYSRCGHIIIVNQDFKEITFDTTFQRFAESRADLNVSQDELGQSELWIGTGLGFRPWSWLPPLEAKDLLQWRIDQVALDASVLETLGLLPVEESGLDARQLDALGDDPATRTFRDVALTPELGLLGRDAPADEETLKRIAAAGIGHWLDRMVLTAQNVLVDAPQLLYRFPSLLPGDPNVETAWNHALEIDVAQIDASNPALASKHVAACNWFSRPTWFWPQLLADESIAEVAAPWTSRSYEWVFAEDASRFINISVASEIQTDLPGPFSRRFIAKFNDVQYRPRNRILQ